MEFAHVKSRSFFFIRLLSSLLCSKSWPPFLLANFYASGFYAIRPCVRHSSQLFNNFFCKLNFNRLDGATFSRDFLLPSPWLTFFIFFLTSYCESVDFVSPTCLWLQCPVTVSLGESGVLAFRGGCVVLHTAGVRTLIVNRRSAAVLCEAEAAADFDFSSELGRGRPRVNFDILRKGRETPSLTQSLLCIPH